MWSVVMALNVSSINSFLQTPAVRSDQAALFHTGLFVNQTGDPNSPVYLKDVKYLVQQQQDAINLASVQHAFPLAASPLPAQPDQTSTTPNLQDPLVTHDFSVPLDLYAKAVSNF